MAQTVIWSDESLSNVEGIADFIARDSLYYAQVVVSEIFAAGESLRDNPKRGRTVPELNNPAIRELFIYNYRLIYEIRNSQIKILAVIHGRRRLESVEQFNQAED